MCYSQGGRARKKLGNTRGIFYGLFAGRAFEKRALQIDA